ncbi:MAG: acetyl-CoA carboxylase biotin carboxyl carrier protein [Acidobacteria bacterium]|nr:acetyl-CoA carboxylase biotin carboxyl carrier protein [Acidobacteriota bacterium]
MGGGRLDGELKDLIEYVEKSSFVEFELERDGFKIKLVKRMTISGNGPAGPGVQAVMPAVPAVTTATLIPPATAAPEESPDIHLIKSPIVGTFYRSNSPGAKAFVETGDRVSKGQVLCIVEAMKLMNEIESDCDGEIVESLVSNGQPVEYGEPLFKIRTVS